MSERFSNIKDFTAFKKAGRKISMVTCYDYSTAKLVASSDVDVILVGDSLGMVEAGFDTTLPVTLEHMIYHTQSVHRGAPGVFLITDMPFMSYHISVEDALKNAGRILKETGAQAVKLEGGHDFRETVRALTRASIPVVGHLGLTPQSVHKIGGYSVQGREDEVRRRLIADAKILEDSGACALVLEMIPEALGREISEELSIATIGIGAGRFTDGQVLVINDLLGMDGAYNPKYLKKYADLSSVITQALQDYHSDVVSKNFPAEKNIFN